MLTATALLGILLLSVLAPMTGLFGVTQRGAALAAAEVRARDAAEEVRGQWQDRLRYRRACVEGGAPVPAPTVQAEDVQGRPLGAAVPVNYRPDCAAAPDLDPPLTGGAAQAEPPPLRRVRVAVSVPGNAPGSRTAVLELELAAP